MVPQLPSDVILHIVKMLDSTTRGIVRHVSSEFLNAVNALQEERAFKATQPVGQEPVATTRPGRPPLRKISQRLKQRWAEGTQDPPTCRTMFLREVVKCTNLLRWARQQRCPWDWRIPATAAAHGQLEAVKWARSNGCPWNDETCSAAAAGGHLEVLKWLRQNSRLLNNSSDRSLHHPQDERDEEFADWWTGLSDFQAGERNRERLAKRPRLCKCTCGRLDSRNDPLPLSTAWQHEELRHAPLQLPSEDLLFPTMSDRPAALNPPGAVPHEPDSAEPHPISGPLSQPEAAESSGSEGSGFHPEHLCRMCLYRRRRQLRVMRRLPQLRDSIAAGGAPAPRHVHGQAEWGGGLSSPSALPSIDLELPDRTDLYPTPTSRPRRLLPPSAPLLAGRKGFADRLGSLLGGPSGPAVHRSPKSPRTHSGDQDVFLQEPAPLSGDRGKWPLLQRYIRSDDYGERDGRALGRAPCSSGPPRALSLGRELGKRRIGKAASLFSLEMPPSPSSSPPRGKSLLAPPQLPLCGDSPAEGRWSRSQHRPSVRPQAPPVSDPSQPLRRAGKSVALGDPSSPMGERLESLLALSSRPLDGSESSTSAAASAQAAAPLRNPTGDLSFGDFFFGMPEALEASTSKVAPTQEDSKKAPEGDCPWSAETCARAAENGHLHVLKWAHQHACPWNEETCARAANAGHLHILKYAWSHGCRWYSGQCTNAAAAGGYLEMLKWARGQGCSWNELTCASAARGGHLEVLQWAVEHGCPWDAGTCTAAASRGHLEVLQWAREKGCPWNERTGYGAVWGGHIHIVEWCFENGCPWDVYTCASAAGAGHLEVLQYLRRNLCPWNAETCSSAAGRGHLDVLTWAHQNGCPWDSKTYRIASERGWHATARWAMDNGCPTED
mmetsp:Transcript_35797/g.101304  ORF Transcript_35797/g.101304 Transcript_35797/m.101304 type:complete len:892 (+) Transcript_35797:527-3202(+)